MFAIDLIRHGDRAPGINIPGIVDKVWDVDQIGMLTDVGEVNSKLLGEKLKKYYFYETGLIREEHSKDEIYIASTGFKRTIATAHHFIQGMFGNNSSEMNLDSMSDRLSGLGRKDSKDKFKRTQLIFQDIPDRKKEEFQDIANYIDEKLGFKIRSMLDIVYLGDLLFVHRVHNKAYPENKFSKERADQLILAKDYLFNFRSRDRRYMCEISKGFVEHIISSFDQKIKDREFQRKLELYFAHDVNILSTIAILGHLKEIYMPPYNSVLKFELYKGKMNMHYVKVSINNKTIPICNKEYCTYSEFHKAVNKSIQSKCI